MRILHVVRQFHPGVGGLENFVFSLAQSQRESGYHVEVLTLDSIFHSDLKHLNKFELIHNIPVHRIPWFGSYKYPIALSSLTLVRGYDLIHVHAIDFFADYLSLFRFLHRTPLVISTHGGFFHTAYASTFKKIYFNLVTRLSLTGYKRVIACSDGDYEQFSSLVKSKLCLIENGVDVNKFLNQCSREFTYNFVFIGRFSDNKRLDLLIDTFHHLTASVPKVQLTIIGRDWDDNQVKMTDQINKYSLIDNVTILTGLNDTQISECIKRHSFIISASEYEGFGLTLVEGMSAGLIPIASPISSFEKIITRAGVGMTIDFNSPESAAAKIYQFIEKSKSDYFQLRGDAIEASLKYGWAKTSTRFLELYEKVLGVKSRVIQGVHIDTKSGSDVIDLVDDAILNKKNLKIAIANAHTINMVRNDHRLRSMFKSFLILNDGVGVNIASKVKYRKWFNENLNGTDFVPKLLAESKLSLRVYLLGASQSSVEKAFLKFSKEYPQHQWIGYHNGYFSESEEALVCSQIKSVSPDLLLVAMGNPKQEEWIDRCAKKTGALVSVGVGALFDFASGKFNRAPLWVRKINCEWVYRLFVEPKRMWRRYLIGNLIFLMAALGDKL